ncbi:hypothetical protein N5F23_04750 [Pseudomonas sichuanensis]|uniref:hypothetical protein n=1 Tax=Pseudomonas TaxID=286 RepID=UPI00129AED13|nr:MULTISPECIES: hypothetical protein [Pseudomonas]MDH0733784.1 hypothetical protein [Pseudomonas sichuanensis]MDH1581897.1 hypothetical protein [Pseudomonas sichuanensis]MDH1591425.1 hypothetical protein [Pseudomonas sichuanensis]MDH1597065.1 hypothetical protein [Pseudomonas sichuanensis]
MQGLIINNTHFEFLRPALERWVDCIDRFNQLQGDADAPYWHGSAANVGMLAAAAWQGELVALQQYQSKKQRDEGEREGRCDLSISNAEASVHLHAGQRWPRIARLDLASALQETAAQAKHIGYASQLKAGALFVTPWKAGQHASPEELQDLVDDLQKHTACAIAWYFPYAYRKLHNELGQYFPGVALLLKQA